MVPSSVTGGGAMANTMASLIWLKAPMARPAIAFTLASALVRSSQSLSLTNTMPLFWPLPAKLKPCTAKVDSMWVLSFLR